MAITATRQEKPQAHQRRATPLWWFASLSLLLHAGLLWHYQQRPLTIAASAPAGMAVQLVERQQPRPSGEPQPMAQAQPAASASKQPISSKSLAVPASEPRRERQAKPVQHTAPAPAALAVAEAAPSEPAIIDETALAASLKVTLQTELARHFSYPLLARRRGWQGEVLLAFRLEADGRISDARVLRSSGYSLLDRAALAALGKVGRLASGAPQGLAMELPVIYRLES